MDQNQNVRLCTYSILGEATIRQSSILYGEEAWINGRVLLGLEFEAQHNVNLGPLFRTSTLDLPRERPSSYFFPEKTCVHRTNTYQYNLGRKLKGKFKIDK